MAIILPEQLIPAQTSSPRKLLIYSSPKVGKTTAASMLEDNLIIDLEQGSRFVSAFKIEVNTVDEIRELVIELSKNPKKFKYGTIDTTTKLEEIILPYAKKLYMDTPMGKNYKDENVLTLPNGAGYLYLREAYNKITAALESCFERVIYFGHLKDKVLEKAGKEVSAKDIDLTGKIRNMACANADAIGYLYRKDNNTILSFVTNQDVICGARPAHLSNKEIILLEKVEDKFVSHWDKIYID